MPAQLLVGSTSTIGGSYGGLFVAPPSTRWLRRRQREVFTVAASVSSRHQRNHYAVLGVSPCATSADIKKAYRLLARKWHPDVSKDSQAGEVFKNIHLAYQVLSNEATRTQYDRELKSLETSAGPIGRNIYYDYEFEDGIRMYKWSKLKQRMRQEKYRKQYNDDWVNHSFYRTVEEEPKNETPVEARGSFIEVLQSTFLSLFLMQTVGSQLSLTFSTLMALFDSKLDTGYKLGYLIAWIMGGRGGVLLTLCLSFASWACGKTSSSMVSLVVVALWVGSNILSFAPLPQGAILTLVYMSIKLQVDVN